VCDQLTNGSDKAPKVTFLGTYCFATLHTAAM
jgi:hypothetical protein